MLFLHTNISMQVQINDIKWFLLFRGNEKNTHFNELSIKCLLFNVLNKSF